MSEDKQLSVDSKQHLTPFGNGVLSGEELG